MRRARKPVNDNAKEQRSIRALSALLDKAIADVQECSAIVNETIDGYYRREAEAAAREKIRASMAAPTSSTKH